LTYSSEVGFVVPIPTLPPAPLFGITIKFPETDAVAGPVPLTLRTAKSAEAVDVPPIKKSRVEASFGYIAPFATSQSSPAAPAHDVHVGLEAPDTRHKPDELVVTALTKPVVAVA
jgi:hypothetical protein